MSVGCDWGDAESSVVLIAALVSCCEVSEMGLANTNVAESRAMVLKAWKRMNKSRFLL